MAKFEIIWEAPEFEYREKTVSWYWITIIVAACLIAFAVWERNILFGLFIIIAEILIILWGNQEPRTTLFRFTEDGIEIELPDRRLSRLPDGIPFAPGHEPKAGHKHHSWKEFESWSTEKFDEELAEISFNFHSKFRMPLKMLAPADVPEEARQHLRTILKEVEHNPTLLETLERLLRF